MKKKSLAVFLSLVLLLASFGTAGCTSAQFTTVLNEVGPAVGVILQIVSLAKGVPVNGSLSAKVTADTAALNTLYTGLTTAVAADKGNVEKQINDAFVVLQADLNSIFTLAQVSNPNTQTKLTSLIGLVAGLVQIAEAAIPTTAPLAAAKAPAVSEADFVSTWNKTLTAKTGDARVDAYTAAHQYHRHGKLVRVLSFGAAQ
jgi:hypothetical protein